MTNQICTPRFANIVLRRYITGSHFDSPHEFQIPKKDVECLSPKDKTAKIKELFARKFKQQYGRFNWKDWEITQEEKFYFIRRKSVKPSEKTNNTNASGAFSNCKVFDVMANHSQVLDVINKAKKEGTLQPDGILVHFDIHSDLYRQTNCSEDRDGSAGIANYVNYLIADGSVSEVYWVLPDWTKLKAAQATFWSEKYEQNGTRAKPYVKGPKDIDLYVDIKGKKIFFEKPKNYQQNPEKYRIVKFHKRTASELPSFRSKNVYLDVDFDYFSNTGYNTSGHTNYNLSSAELSNALSQFSLRLIEKGIDPSVVTLARSPRHTPSEDIPIIEKKFRSIFRQKEYISDNTDNYDHWHYDAEAVMDMARFRSQIENGAPKVCSDKVGKFFHNYGFHNIEQLHQRYCSISDKKSARNDLLNKIEDATNVLKYGKSISQSTIVGMK